ncbi:MAG: CotH kinase family protein, partial [Planctomycetes bacterium]|nr:CotH kinase family protein [Planctomycetota bacterium]
WFLALDNALADDDGYASRGSDYLLWRDPSGRFHPIPRDNNEILLGERGPGGPGGPGGRRPRGGELPGGADGGGPPNAGPPNGGDANGGPGAGPGGRRGPGGGVANSPLDLASRRDRPLVRRLLEVPAWRQRYLANLRELLTGALAPANIAPRLQTWRQLLQPIVDAGASRTAFARSFASTADGLPASGSLLSLIALRSKLLLGDQSLQGEWPVLDEPEAQLLADGTGGSVLTVRAKAHGARIAAVHLHHAEGKFGAFAALPMHDDGKHGDGGAGDGVYGASLPLAAGTTLRYWVEATAATGHVDCQPAGNGAMPAVVKTPKPGAGDKQAPR